MGRVLKRVPMDFDWPLEVIWKGYLNPYEAIKCKPCGQSGLNPETKAIQDEWYDLDSMHIPNNRYTRWCDNLTHEDVLALAESNHLDKFTGHPLNDEQREQYEKLKDANGRVWPRFNNGYIPSTKEVNEWIKSSHYIGSNFQWVCVKARAKREGVYGDCKYCKGKGYYFISDEIEKLHDEWKEVDPPEGEGFQLWCTTTEGHPMSPIFDTLRGLCDWLGNTGASVFGDSTATSDEWYKMLNKGFVSHQEGNMIFF